MLCASLLVEKYPSACLLYLIIIFSFISPIMHLHDIKTFIGYYFIFTVKPEFSLTFYILYCIKMSYSVIQVMVNVQSLVHSGAWWWGKAHCCCHILREVLVVVLVTSSAFSLAKFGISTLCLKETDFVGLHWWWWQDYRSQRPRFC